MGDADWFGAGPLPFTTRVFQFLNATDDIMWQMQDGDRVVTEAEWSLFSIALKKLRAQIEQDIIAESDDAETGIAGFDSFTAAQKLALIADVAEALRDPRVASPTHTVCNEAVILAIFAVLRGELEAEVDVSQHITIVVPIHVRQSLLAACANSTSFAYPLPDLDGLEVEQWDWLLVEIQERVFLNYDYSLGDDYLDLPPEEAEEKLKLAEMSPDYYMAIPPEPDKYGLFTARQTLESLMG